MSQKSLAEMARLIRWVAIAALLLLGLFVQYLTKLRFEIARVRPITTTNNVFLVVIHAVQVTLEQKVRDHPNSTLLEDHYAIDLITSTKLGAKSSPPRCLGSCPGRPTE